MFGKRPIVSSLKGMVVAAHPLASFAGARILRDGGNAFDAAAATAAALNVCEPFMSGLAGLGMATCYVAAEKRVRSLDFITRVPSEFDAAACGKNDIFRGPLASAAPGSLAAWCKLVADYGTKTRAEVFAPAIELARDGFPVTDLMHAINAEWGELRRENEEWVRVYTDGGAVPEGGILRQPDLARTYEAIVSEGPGYLYGGDLGRRMIAHLRSLGGRMTLADLEAVEPRWLDPIAVAYRSLAVHSLPPPAESFQFLLTLRILDGFDLAVLARDGVDHLDTVFRAIRLAAERRIRNNNKPVEEIEALLADGPVAELRARLRDPEPISGRAEQWAEVPSSALALAREHTSSFALADAGGNMVCVTQSLGSGYGSGVVIPGTGVCMNNFLNWGDLDPASPNHLRAGGPLAMCLAPSVSTAGGEPVLALGTPGSYGILQTQCQAMVHHLDFGLGLQDAIDAPRARLWDGTQVDVESRIDETVIEGLRRRGHDVRVVDPYTRVVGGMHGIRRDPDSGALTGGADARRDGYAVAP